MKDYDLETITPEEIEKEVKELDKPGNNKIFKQLDKELDKILK